MADVTTTEVRQPNRREERIRTSWKSAHLLSYGLFLTGLIFIMLSIIGHNLTWAEWITSFVRDFGLLLSAVVAGSILHEKVLRDEMIASTKVEFGALLDRKIPDILTQTDIATKVHEYFNEHPPGMTGLRLLSETRRNYAGYYEWVNRTEPQELFFAGRSVLHRIDADIRMRHRGSSAEDTIFRRLREGSKIEILFLDPRINIVDRLAYEEGQDPKDMLSDIAISIGICRRLFDLLNGAPDLPPSAELTVRIYDRIPYFAFHKQDHQIIIGFYFTTLGSSSSAYEIVDDETKRTFSDHFSNIAAEATQNIIVSFSGAYRRPRFGNELYVELRKSLADRLGEGIVHDLIEGSGHHRSSTQ
jgi:hypothetical protein